MQIPGTLTPDNRSEASWLSSASDEEIEAWIDGLTEAEARELEYTWEFWARKNQLPPRWAWRVWFICAGRGFGKTRTGAEWIRDQAEEFPGIRLALVGKTKDDVRKVMVEGRKSGILAVCPPWNRPDWKPGLRELRWANGSICFCYSSDAPEQLRGPEHAAAWVDEPAKMLYLDETWSNLKLGLRDDDLEKDGRPPQITVTGTPRPLPFLHELAAKETTALVQGSTDENLENLSPEFIEDVYEEYGGTEKGREELRGELLNMFRGALWSTDMIKVLRTDAFDSPFGFIGSLGLKKIAIGVDPAEESTARNDKTGICSVGIDGDGMGYGLSEAEGNFTAGEWSKLLIEEYLRWRPLAPVEVVVETNRGGEMAEHMIRLAFEKAGLRPPRITAVKSKDAKGLRAQPVALLYEQDRFRHVGHLPAVESQMVSFVPGVTSKSPNALDAFVCACTALFPKTRKGFIIKRHKPRGY